MVIGSNDSLMDFKSSVISDYSSRNMKKTVPVNNNSNKNKTESSDKFTISKEAQNLIIQKNGLMSPVKDTEKSSDKKKDKEKDKKEKQLSNEEKQVVNELKSRDLETRVHEQSHIAAAGGYAKGGASYSFQTGPDGKQYAVGGSVQIDSSAVPNNPEATLRKAQVVRQAALAPKDPSGTDRAVAASASSSIMNALKQMQDKRSEKAEELLEKENDSEIQPKENDKITESQIRRNKKKLKQYK